MIINIDEFYNNKNWKQYVPLEAFQEELRLVGETFLKDVKVKNVLSITYSVDNYGENPIYIEYLDENDQKHLVKLKPAIHAELESVLSKYATIDYTNQKFAEAVQTSKDYTDQAKEALTILINGSKEEAIQVSKAYTDVEINKLNTDLRAYIDETYGPLWQELPTYADSAVREATNISSAYTDDEIDKVKQEVKNYTDTQLTNYETKADASIDHDKLINVPNGHKNPYISWFPDIDSNYIRIANDQSEIKLHIDNPQTGVESIGYLSTRNPANFATKTEAENANKVYEYDTTSDTWNKCDGNFTVCHDNSNITKLGYRQTTGEDEKTIVFNDFATKLDALFFRGTIGAQNPSLNNLQQGFYHFYFENENTDSTYPNDMQGQVSTWGSILQMGYTNGICTQLMIRTPGDTMYIRTHYHEGWNSWHKVTAPLANVNAEMLNLETVEAIAQEQTALNAENVPVSLQQKARTTREVKNNSTLVNTKDFLILNLDFSFVPNVLPTSVGTSFIENNLVDAPEFNGKSFDITFKANEHTATSKGVVGEPLTIKTCAFPIDETIKNVEVVVKDKIIIRKETE